MTTIIIATVALWAVAAAAVLALARAAASADRTRIEQPDTRRFHVVRNKEQR